MLERTGVVEAVLAEDERISAADELGLWREALDVTGDDQLGLRAAQTLRRGTFGALEYAVQSSATLTEALHRLARFARLHGAALATRFEPDPEGGATLGCPPVRHDDPRLSAVLGDFRLAALYVLGSHAVGAPMRVERARLGRPTPRRPEPYLELFGPRVEFGAERCELEFPADALGAPMRQRDDGLCRVLEEYLQRDLEAMDVNETFLARVREALRGRLAWGEPSVAGVAEALGIRERTLQRRLSELDTTFQDELDQVRRELALRLLRRADTTTHGVALLLGYAEVSTFHRAFRRWTGTTPGRFRRS